MPAIPVMQPRQAPDEIPEEIARALSDFEPRVYERGDRLIMVSKVQTFTPQDAEIEEYAFSKAVKKNAPNDNIVWFKGQYVEADHANRNGAQWTAGELAIKSLTPMLMPVTVMHDPRTAVGTIADVKMLTPEKDNVARARIDTVLALWGHRFPEAVGEAEVNAKAGTLMQSMECFSPWYSCSECGQQFHKLPHGAEQAMWCSHLKASRPSAGSVDFMPLGRRDQNADASRILGDVTFTGTGLIFGSRGARGAYSEAFLENFGDELAVFHQNVHSFTASVETDQGRTASMGVVQIEQSELDLLRKERDDARAEAVAMKQERDEQKTAAETAEAAKVQAEEAKAASDTKVTELTEAQAKVELKAQRWDALGAGFVAKLGDTTKKNLQGDAETKDEAGWEARLVEVEELTATKRDAKADGSTPKDPPAADDDEQAGTFNMEELAQLGNLGGSDGASGVPNDIQRQSVVGSLASAFSPAKSSSGS